MPLVAKESLYKISFFRWGLEQVKFKMENDFVRGWDVFNERTLDTVTVGYLEIRDYLKHVSSIVNSGNVEKHMLAAYAVQCDKLLHELVLRIILR